MPANHPSGRGTTPHAVDWLGNEPKAAQVLATARHLLAIEAAVMAALPPALGQHSKVARLENQRLTLAVPGPAHAAKLRQLTPSLIQTLASNGWNISEIGIRIQAERLTVETKPTERETQPLDQTALAAFSELAGNLPPGPLASAIERLLIHHNYRSGA